MTPLHKAALAGDTAVVKSYVDGKRNLDPKWDEPTRGLEGNYARRIGLTPLMLAARTGQLEVAKLLVDGGANVYAEANTQLPGDPITAFDLAVDGGSVQVAQYLWSKSDGVRLGARLPRQIVAACQTSCREGAGTEAKTNLALFLLRVAPAEAAGNGIGQAACASIKPLEMLAFVEKYAARPPRNTLHCMAYQTFSRHRPWEERKAVLTWMLDHGAEVNGRLYGRTPLRGAAAAHDLDTAKLLLARGADPNARDDVDGIPPIAGAADTCIHTLPPGGTNTQLEAELAMVEYLVPMSDKRSYASPEVLKKAYLIGRCCAEQPQAATQRRICEVFGL